MKKIVLINHYGVTPDKPGPTKNYEMTKYFAEKMNIPSEFWICGFNHYNSKMEPALKGFKFQNVEKKGNYSVVKIKSTPYKNNKILRQLNIICFDLISAFKILISKDIDCIILTVPSITFFNVLATKIKKIKLVVDVQDLWPLFLFDMGLKNKAINKFFNFLADFTYNSSDAIDSVSEGMQNYVKTRLNGIKYQWISPLGVNFASYSKVVKNPELISSKEWKNDFKVMYLGVHGRANDLESVLKTIEILNKSKLKNTIGSKNISFIFIGNGDEKEKLISIKNELKLKNVYFEDSVPGDQVPDYLVHSDICLTNLLKIESFKLVRPNKLFQYMALGKPIITGIWGEFKSIVEEYKSGIYVDFTNHDLAAKKISDLITDENLMNQMSQNGVKYIEQFGDRDKIFSEYYNHLMKICM